MSDETVVSPGRTLLFIISGAVVITILVALSLAWLDDTQRRSALPSRGLPIVDIEATIAAGDFSIVHFPPIESEPVAQVVSIDTITPTITVAIVAGTATVTIFEVQQSTCESIPTDWLSYEVKPGDTLSGLAARTGQSVNSIIQGNCLQLAQVIVGQSIHLPPAAAPPVEATESCGVPSGWEQYPVQPTDTMLGLSWQRNTTVFLIMRANCMEDSRLASGRVLFLPPLPPATQPPPENVPSPNKPAGPGSSGSGPLSPTPTRVRAQLRPPTTTPVAPKPSPTPSPTATALATNVPPSLTPSATIQVTVATPEQSPTSSPMPSATYTSEPPPPSATATETQLPSATPSPLPSPSPSFTPTQTPSMTASPSPTITNTPTATSSPTPTVPPNPGGALPPTPTPPLPYPGYPAYPA